MNRHITPKRIAIMFGIGLTLAVTFVNTNAAGVRGTVRSCIQGRENPVSAQVVFWDKATNPSAENVRFTSTNGDYRFDDLNVGRLYYLAVIKSGFASVPVQEVFIESDVSKDLGRTCLTNPFAFMQFPYPPFPKDSSVISPEMAQRFRRDLNSLRSRPSGSYILISGYTSADEDPVIGLSRAEALRDFFVAQQIPETDFQLRSLTDSCPEPANRLSENRRVTYDIIREDATALDVLRTLHCAPGSVPRIIKPDDVRVVRIEETANGLAVTLTYNYRGRKGNPAYIIVSARAESVTPVASASALLERGERSITLNLTRDPGSLPTTTTELTMMMLQNKKHFHYERFAYTKRWK
jgi:outer membrane protein OmpA-like peptidoglycan-associated protein